MNFQKMHVYIYIINAPNESVLLVGRIICVVVLVTIISSCIGKVSFCAMQAENIKTKRIKKVYIFFEEGILSLGAN